MEAELASNFIDRNNIAVKIDEIIKKYEIENKAITSAALIALLEPCVLLASAISPIIGQEVRVSIEDREIEDNLITLDLSMRPK